MQIELKKHEDISGKVTFVYYEAGFPEKIFSADEENIAKSYFNASKKRREEGYPKTETILKADV